MGNLKSLGLVMEKGHEYCITPNGVVALGKAKSAFAPEELDAIADFKKFLNDLTEDEILLFTYVSYPKFKSESTVYERVIKKRIPVAVSLYNKGKVSLEKAAFLPTDSRLRNSSTRYMDKMKIFDTSSIICILHRIRFPQSTGHMYKTQLQVDGTTRQVYYEIQKNRRPFKRLPIMVNLL